MVMLGYAEVTAPGIVHGYFTHCKSQFFRVLVLHGGHILVL